MAKKYKCPYCNDKYIRKDLINHIDKEHEELIPDGFESAQVVYDIANNTKGAGRCRVCGKATKWNPNAKRYDVLCENPRCKQKMREDYQKNMLRVHGTYNILTSDEQQKKMLANRSISGTYKFTDSGVVTYTGSYEKKFLEFADKVMQIPSKDIMAPGPTIEYEMNGEKHFYITDFLYIPYNLIIEVKDGGNNPNTKNTPGMQSSRQRTIEKEKLITDRGEFNYLRLTDNQFVQLLEIFMDIKKALIEGDDGKIVRINESYISESLETRLTTNPFKDTMTLYHGSDMKFDLIAPLSYNAGTKLSGVRMSSFWSDDINIARRFGMFTLIGEMGYLIAFKPDLSGFLVLPSQYKEIINKLKSKKIYIYEKTLSKKFIGIGHSNYFDEYTIDVPVSPDKVYVQGYNQFKDIMESISVFPTDDRNEVDKLLNVNHKELVTPKKFNSRLLVVNDYKYFKSSIKQVRKLKEDANESYITEYKSYDSLLDFGAYHLEPKVKAKNKNKPGIGIWDEELYYKSIEAAIINDIKHNNECERYNRVSAYVYTAGKNLKPIYLGTITVFDKNDPNNWEWEEREFINKSDYDYLKKNPMVESMDISNFYDEDYY